MLRGEKKEQKQLPETTSKMLVCKWLCAFPACSDSVGMYVYTPTPNFCRVAASLWRFGGKLTRCCDLREASRVKESVSLRQHHMDGSCKSWFLSREWQEYLSTEMSAWCFCFENTLLKLISIPSWSVPCSQKHFERGNRSTPRSESCGWFDSWVNFQHPKRPIWVQVSGVYGTHA